MKKIFSLIFAPFIIISCQKLPPEAYIIDKYKIEGDIHIDKTIENQCKGTLFIIVRKGASPQPLAAKKFTNPSFPIHFSLTPADTLMPQRMNEFEGELVLMAKISKNGNPMSQKGDCESNAMVVKAGDKDIKILINNIRK